MLFDESVAYLQVKKLPCLCAVQKFAACDSSHVDRVFALPTSSARVSRSVAPENIDPSKTYKLLSRDVWPL